MTQRLFRLIKFSETRFAENLPEADKQAIYDKALDVQTAMDADDSTPDIENTRIAKWDEMIALLKSLQTGWMDAALEDTNKLTSGILSILEREQEIIKSVIAADATE